MACIFSGTALTKSRFVMLSAAKHLYVNRAGPFATLRVTALKWQEHDRAKLSMDFVKTLHALPLCVGQRNDRLQA